MAERGAPNPAPLRAIGEHGIIGNLGTAALVALDGTIDFLCWPNLDSPSIFAALLDPAEGGDGDGVVFSGGDFLPLRLSGCVSVKVGEGEARAEFELKAGEEVFFVLQ